MWRGAHHFGWMGRLVTGRRMRGLGWVLGWCSEWVLGGIGFRKKWGFPLELPRIVLWGVKEWSSLLVLCLWNVPDCSRWGPPRIGDSWTVGPSLSNLACAQSAPLRLAHHLLVSSARLHHLARNLGCRVERTS